MALFSSKKDKYSAGVIGTFEHVDRLVEATRQAHLKSGIEVRDVFSPVPVPEVAGILSPKKSPVRFVTFGAAVTGMVGGFALAILTALVWNLVVGGMPVAHHIPFVVVGFELTILLGASGTLLALLLFARLPYRRFPGPAYRPEFSKDRFGIWLSCEKEALNTARELLLQAGARSVDPVGKGK